MKKIYSLLSFVFALTFAFSFFSVTAFAKNNVVEDVDSAMDQILSTYYYSLPASIQNSIEEPADFSIEDPYSVVDTDSHIDIKKLIPTFSTNTSSKSAMLTLCQKIKDGEHLADFLDSDAQLYTVTTDAAGNDTGYAIVGMDDFSVLEFGELNEYTRKDFQSFNILQNAVTNNELDVAETKMVFCVIENFSTGSLLSDGSNEYFIPAVDGIESMGILEVGEMYLVSDVFKLIEANIDTIFPKNEVDENGNPYLGAGTPTSNSFNPSIETVNGTKSVFFLISLAGIVGSIICFAFAYKNARKEK